MPSPVNAGDRVVVVKVPWVPASASFEGRGGQVVTLNAERAIAGVRLEHGAVHLMPTTCLRPAEPPAKR